MKKLNRKLIRGTNWALAGLLSLLGFTGCGKDDNGGGEISVEYGAPSANFKVLGRVTNEQGQPLGGMRVVASEVTAVWGKGPKQCYSGLLRDTVYTASDGTFVRIYSTFPADSVYIHMKIEDSAEPSVYDSDSIAVGFAKDDLKGDDRGWYLGAAEKQINVTLKRKKK
ncbi:MAG: radical SAM-associated putative lipoprotein [Tannerella sp.]